MNLDLEDGINKKVESFSKRWKMSKVNTVKKMVKDFKEPILVIKEKKEVREDEKEKNE
jgi:hypothetical protein